MQSKESTRASKGKVSIYIENERIKARLPRQYFGGVQQRIALGLAAIESNMALAHRIAEKMTLDLQDGCFDETLEKYGIKGNNKITRNDSTSTYNNQPLEKPQLSTLEIYEMYCEYKKGKLAITTYEDTYLGEYLNAINEAIDNTDDNAVKIHNWLLDNRAIGRAKRVLSVLDHAYQLAIKQNLITHNPFFDLHKDIESKQSNKTYKQNEKINEDQDILDKAKCYTWEESLILRDYVRNKPNISHWYHIISFRFLTGCRPGEAYGLWWNDVKWDKECIIIRRSYASSVKKFKPTKNNTERIFPMPKDGELWKLLKELPQGEPYECVFKSKTGKIVSRSLMQNRWDGNERSKNKGIVPELIKQGQLKRHFPFYNCRHTFVTHQIFDLGRDPEIVNAWCEHSDTVSRKHYRDVSSYALQSNPDLPANQVKSELELLKEQNAELLRRLEQLEKKNK